MEKNNLKEEEWNTYECEVYLSHCSCITKYVKAPTLEAAIAYLEKKYPEARRAALKLSGDSGFTVPKAV